MPTERPVLELCAMEVRYGSVVAVNQVSLEVHADEIVALIGPNGAGKTSLFNAAAGTIRPRHGQTWLDGVDISRWPAHRRARQGLVRTFQSGKLFTRLTVRDNIELATYAQGRSRLGASILTGPSARLDRRRARRRSAAVLTAAGLERYADTTCSALPYGIQRRVELARALCVNPRILLLDEPSAGLDTAESAELGRMIQRIRDQLGIPVLLIEHDMTLVMGISDYVYVIDFGVPLAAGTPNEVRSHPAVVAAYLGEDVVA